MQGQVLGGSGMPAQVPGAISLSCNIAFQFNGRSMIAYQPTRAFALQQDKADPLASFREQFHFPTHEGKDVIYFCGNSLGLQPITAKDAIATELQTWRDLAVGGYFSGPNPWLTFHQTCIPALAQWVGAGHHEVTVMNALTVNLHLMMMSFYRPKGERYKIIMEAGAFPSDQYAI
ncbi:MAG TPA: hypothetical protein VK907_06175, partial [Phnomibacter sp.]|nr:hypothetical protein [Phnomibacter sp.]